MNFKYESLNKDDAAVLFIDHQTGLASLVGDYSAEFENTGLTIRSKYLVGADGANSKTVK